MSETLHVLSAGAAQGLLKALQGSFEASHGVTISARFGAVGAMQEALLSGEPCDLFVTTAAIADRLVGEGRLEAAGRSTLGQVPTGIAVPRGRPHPDVTTPAALRTALAACTSLHFPDPERATAGIHFARVLSELGLAEPLRSRCRTYPNGATAMRALAESDDAVAVGCTQVTEILYTEGVDLVAELPSPFELSTPYVATVVTKSPRAALAARLIETMCGSSALELRRKGGFA